MPIGPGANYPKERSPQTGIAMAKGNPIKKKSALFLSLSGKKKTPVAKAIENKAVEPDHPAHH